MGVASAGPSRVRIGISGWTYPGWRGDFYPAGLPHRDELRYASSRLPTIELNGSFYSLQRPDSYRAWREQTPDDFVFSVKGGRFITHMKRLLGVETALANFFASGPLALGPKLGPILWQLPPTLAHDAERMDGFLTQLPRTTEDAAALAKHHDAHVPEDRALTVAESRRPLRHAIEVRHHSFAGPEAIAQLRAHDVGLVVADTAGRYPFLDAPTTDFVYVRLHGDAELYAGGYTGEALDRWAERIAEWSAEGRDVYAYFDNEMKGYAPFDALALIERLRSR